MDLFDAKVQKLGNKDYLVVLNSIMSTLNKFIIYECNTCKRRTEIMIDGNRPDPIRCNITYKCRGKLQRVGESAAKKFLFTPPVIGLQDYISRGTVIEAAPSFDWQPAVQIASSGGVGMFTVAALKKVDNGNGTHDFVITDSQGNTFSVDTQANNVLVPEHVTLSVSLFPISPGLLDYKRFTYLLAGTVDVIQGADNSPESNTLRFSSTNSIRIFINGVELDAQYYDRSVDNQITFTPTIYDLNNVVDVLVYNDLSANIDQSDLIVLEFISLNWTQASNLAFRQACSWGDVQSVKIDGIENFLLYCIDTSVLKKDTSYGIKSFKISNMVETRDVNTSEIFWLLSNDPFSFQDKELNAFIQCSSLMTSTAYATFEQSLTSGSYELTVPRDLITDTINPIVPTNKIDTETLDEASNVSSFPEQISHKYILGPT